MFFSTKPRITAALMSCLLLLCTCCSPLKTETIGNVDLMQEAIAMSDYSASGLYNLKSYGYGEGKFQDYLDIHANPLNSAEYVLSTANIAHKAGNSAKRSSEFCDNILREKGFCCDTNVDYPITNKPEEALEWIFKFADEPTGLEEAKKDLSQLNFRIKKPLAHWLSAVAKAYSMIAEENYNLSEFYFYVCKTYQISRFSELYNELENVRQVASNVSLETYLKAGALLISASAKLADKLKADSCITNSNKKVTIETPIGNLVFGTTNDDTYNSPDALLLLDSGGNDNYLGKVASGSSLSHNLSVAIDLTGDDVYDAKKDASQGCGVLGAGLLFDMSGNDKYKAYRMSQGCAVLGVGLLYDRNGNDSYDCDLTGQASGIYGLAVLTDGSGDDSYKAVSRAQASAGNRCMAYLIDNSGNDNYFVPDITPEEYSWLDYGGEREGHTENASQGCGWGQRSITTPERGIAGGIAGILDFSGNDEFNGGLWVQGTGYWSGIGFIYNIGGNDKYKAYYYSQASVAHYGAGIVIDEKGDDCYDLNVGAGLSFVWDRGLSLLLDDGGNDRYLSDVISGGCADSYYDSKGIEAQDMTYSIFVDTKGDDLYYSGPNECWGYGRGGFAIDSNGDDTYYIHVLKNDCKLSKVGQKGGVFIDQTENKDENFLPYVKFWSIAKQKYQIESN